ncbi:proprotein convertase P-domain-containing protein [Alcanivorax sp. DP30]|uniref:proprotein convertase P-domain-containing protein n=1 Tax=Alcanivorax sp. DP30 TaxID=2606217 RepID=UPI00136F3E8E|nr:proprotein convertase P-domain-containing protein [Alcanivorax sp. DP30]MZR63246.1 DUF11 domain-containing protein [Alcanivorax sp. DP30]
MKEDGLNQGDGMLPIKWHNKITAFQAAGWLLPLVLVCGPVHAAQTSCANNGGAGWPITNGSQTTIDINYDFADLGEVTDINVDVDISHTYTGDLTARITSPQGSTVSLFERPNTAAAFNQDTGPYGCSGNDIDVLFDDESPNGPLENAACGNNPAFSGTHRTHNPAPNNLSAFDGQNPVGIWNFFFMDPVSQDTGTMNEACIVVSSAAVTFDQWVSSNATCSDQLDSLSILNGSNVYVCYTLTNPGDEALVLNSGDWNDSLGNDLSSLEGSYAPGATQTLNFGPFVAGSTTFPLGVTNATADVTLTGNSVNFPSSRTLFTDEAATVAVANSPPATGNKPLYLYSNNDLSRVPTAANQAEITFNAGISRSWTLTPALQSSLDLNTAGGQIPVTLYLRRNGNYGGSFQRDMTLTIAGSASGVIGTTSTSISMDGTSTAYTINVPITGASTLVSGEAITFTFTNNTSGQRGILLDPSDGANNRSLINLPSNTVINIDSIQVYDQSYATNPAATPVSSIQPGQTAYIRALISDPFGSFDISSATIDLTDPASTLQVDDGAMTLVFDSGTNTGLYEYAFNVSPFVVQGEWQFSVTGNEGTEGVFHTDYIDFPIVAPPALSVVKTASVASASPGDPVTHFITVTNSGSGPASNVHLSDNLSPFTTLNTGSFSCSSGCPGSGVTLGTPSYTMDGGGKIIQWEVDMVGSLNAGGGSFTIQYQVNVD